jgi:hypothetical protein
VIRRLLARLRARRRPLTSPIVVGRIGSLRWRSLTPDEQREEDRARRERIEQFAAPHRTRTPWLRRRHARPWLS